MRSQFIKQSTNIKTGQIPTTNSSSDTCPDACPLKTGGCYAKAHPYIKANWDKLDQGTRGSSWGDFLGNIRSLRSGQIWRHNVAGDLPGSGDKIDREKFHELIDANQDARGFTYTHYPVWMHKHAAHNVRAIRYANKRGFTVNLSANNLDQGIFYKRKFNIPTTALVPLDHDGRTKVLKDGTRLIPCPAENSEHVTCASCKMCADPDRNSIILFKAHGKQKNQVSIIARG